MGTGKAFGVLPLGTQHEPRRRNKFVAFGLAFFKALRRLPILRVGLQPPMGLRWRVTPSVIVCTNPYQMRMFGLEGVSYPDRGVLDVYLARTTRGLAVALLALRALVRRVDTARGLEALTLPSLELHLHRRRVPVSVDGEVATLETPLVYRIRKASLRVLTPPEPALATAG